MFCRSDSVARYLLELRRLFDEFLFTFLRGVRIDLLPEGSFGPTVG